MQIVLERARGSLDNKLTPDFYHWSATTDFS